VGVVKGLDKLDHRGRGAIFEAEHESFRDTRRMAGQRVTWSAGRWSTRGNATSQVSEHDELFGGG